MPWCTPRVLRHTAAVHMAEDGVSMAEIGQFLGHTSEMVTFRVYARFSPTHLRRVARTFTSPWDRPALSFSSGHLPGTVPLCPSARARAR